MKFILTKKDIIATNQAFEDGDVINESSLDFAIDYARHTANWQKALAYLTRAILIDHVFEEGNKRTTMMMIRAYAEYSGHGVYDEKLLRLIKYVMKNRITSIRRLEELINDVIR